MYIPAQYKMHETDEMMRFMHDNPFAIIVSDTLHATHVPVEIEKNSEGKYVIRTHVSKANPHWRILQNGKEVMVIFNGPHTYISSSWYDHVNVPTWNYMAVHVYGIPGILQGEIVRDMLDRLVNRYEKNSVNPVHIDKMPADFFEKHLKGIVALEISIDRMEGVKKLSQNRDEKNFSEVIKQLEMRMDAESAAVAKEMSRLKDELFK
ncbi:MAG: FMN-binding negative transcriptional regulator [Chitinophagales bacterium]